MVKVILLGTASNPIKPKEDTANNGMPARDYSKFEFGDPRDRPFTQLAAKMINAHNALNAGVCPTCQSEIKEFRNEISSKEFSISGMCQACQDSVFGAD